jgi:hypothetical protein
MWSPFEVRLGGKPPPSAPPPDRPANVIGLFSDLSKNPKQAVTFVLMIGGILFIGTVCFAGVCVAVVEAAKGVKGVPLRSIASVGVSGASLLTLITTLLTGWIRRRRSRRSVKPAQADGGGGRRRDGS